MRLGGPHGRELNHGRRARSPSVYRQMYPGSCVLVLVSEGKFFR
jgi:hypothetical protein